MTSAGSGTPARIARARGGSGADASRFSARSLTRVQTTKSWESSRCTAETSRPTRRPTRSSTPPTRACSAAVYAYPLDGAAAVAIGATREALELHPPVEEARFWLFGDEAYAAFEHALA